MKNSATSSGEALEVDDDGDTGDEAGGRAQFAAALAKELEGEKPVDTGNEGEPNKGTPRESTQKGMPKSLEMLAERLGVEVSELYSLPIPVGQGREPLTLGKAKDMAAQWASLDADRLAFSEERVKQESELTRGRSELRELIALLPREHLKPELLQRVAARVQERTKAQEAQVPVLIPEWRDADMRKKEEADITTMLEGYGLTAPEVKGIRDPRLIKFLRDSMNREKLVRNALAAVKKPERKPVRHESANGAPRRQVERQQPNTMKPTSGREQFRTLLAEG